MTRFLSGFLGFALIIFALGLAYNIMAGAAAVAHKTLWDYMGLNTYNKWTLLPLLWQYNATGVIIYTLAAIIGAILCYYALRDHDVERADKPHDPNLRA